MVVKELVQRKVYRKLALIISSEKKKKSRDNSTTFNANFLKDVIDSNKGHSEGFK